MVREFGESPNLRKSLEEDWKIPSTKYWIRDSITVRRLLSASLEDYPLPRNFLLGLKTLRGWDTSWVRSARESNARSSAVEEMQLDLSLQTISRELAFEYPPQPEANAARITTMIRRRKRRRT